MRTSLELLELGAGEALVAVQQALRRPRPGRSRCDSACAGPSWTSRASRLRSCSWASTMRIWASAADGGPLGSVTREVSSRARKSHAFSRLFAARSMRSRASALLTHFAAGQALPRSPCPSRSRRPCASGPARVSARRAWPPAARPSRCTRRGTARERRGGSWRRRRPPPGPRPAAPRGDRRSRSC